MTDAIKSRRLDWDSDFFGWRCHRLELNAAVDKTDLTAALQAVGGAEFVCIVNRDCNIQNAELIGALTDAYVADTNIQFVKTLDKKGAPSSIPARDRFPASPAIVDLANKVYRESRFMRDGRFASCGGGKVFGEWVNNAFDITGKYFATAEENGQLAGFVLFSISDNVLAVELIGVEDGLRGRGVGRQLWHRAEDEAFRYGCSAIQVGTQLTNLDAVNFYIRMGCAVSHTAQTYHLWL